MKEELFTRKQMENAVMLAADLYQRLYNSPATDGGALEVAGTVIDEACRMEAWLTEKYGEDDDCYLDRMEEYEGMMVEKYELEEKPKQEVWEFDEQTFIEHYCPMEGGNDYLGWIDDICKLLDGEAEPGDAASTGEYANLSEEELRKELKRLTAIVLHQAVDRYVEQNY